MKSRSGAQRWRVAAAAWLVWTGCAAGGVPPEELPEAPLAFVHRTLEEGRQRAEWIEKREGGGTPQEEGVMNLNDAGSYLDRVRGRSARHVPDRFGGRVALLHPASGRVEFLDALLPGARPLDWTPDRRKLLFATPRSGVVQIYELDLVAGRLSPAISGRNERPQATYGPPGRIAYAELDRRKKQPKVSIWATRPRGRPVPLTDGMADAGPTWSADGRWLLFENADARGRRLIVSLDLEAERPEPRVVARGADPEITPQGDWVVYAREGRHGWRLWRMRPDGTGKSALGERHQGSADERQPTVSPDGRFVAYVALEDRRERLRIRRFDGTGDRPLLQDGDGALPVW